MGVSHLKLESAYPFNSRNCLILPPIFFIHFNLELKCNNLELIIIV